MWPGEDEPIWWSLRKGGTNIHVQWMKHAYSNNLYADETSLKTEGGIEVRVDLNRNLAKRNRSMDQRHDAEDLLEHIRDLTCIQLTDEHIIERIGDHLERMDNDGEAIPKKWGLTVRLRGDHHFLVRPESKARSLFLYVEEVVSTSGLAGETGKASSSP